MSVYNVPNLVNGYYIAPGATTYPYTFEVMLGDYSGIVTDINTSYTTLGVPQDQNYFEYLTNFILTFSPEGVDFSVAGIIDGTLMQGGSAATVQNNGFFVPTHVYNNNNLTLQGKIAEMGNRVTPILPEDVELYLKYDGDSEEWMWVEAVGIKPPNVDPETGKPTTENAIPRWKDDTGTALLNSNVKITSTDVMYGQGVYVEGYATNITLDETHKGKVLRYTSAGGDITLPLDEDPDVMIGFQCVVINSSETGDVQIVPATGVTLQYKISAGDPAAEEWPFLDGQHSAVSIIKIASNTWGVYGDLAPIVV